MISKHQRDARIPDTVISLISLLCQRNTVRAIPVSSDAEEAEAQATAGRISIFTEKGAGSFWQSAGRVSGYAT